MNVSLYTRRSVLRLDEPLQGQPGPFLEARRHASDHFVVYANDEERIPGLQPEPVSPAFEEAKGAAFDLHRLRRSAGRIPERLPGIGVRDANDIVDRD